jgi:parallel beta-helix repeat protein
MTRTRFLLGSLVLPLAACGGGGESSRVGTISAADTGNDSMTGGSTSGGSASGGSTSTGSGAGASSAIAGVTIACGASLQDAIDANPAGTTFVLAANCTYRLTEPIVPKSGDVFSGHSPCAPPAMSCSTVVSGSVIIGPLARFDGTNWAVTGQTQHGTVSNYPCEPGWSGCNYSEDLWFDGAPYQHLAGTTKPVIATGQWWFDYAHQTIYFHDNPAGHLVETSVARAFAVGESTKSSTPKDPTNNVTFQYLTVEEFAAPISQGTLWPSFGTDALQQSTGLDWTISHCELWGSHSSPVKIGFGMHILDNYSHDNGQVGFGGGTDPDDNLAPSRLLVEGNLVTHNNYAHVDPGFGAGGMKFGRIIDAVVKSNTVKDNGGSGIHFDVSSIGPLIDGNTVIGNDGDGLRFEIGLTSATFRNNVVQYNHPLPGGNSTEMTSAGSSTGVDAYCNVVELGATPGENGMIVVAAVRGDNVTGPPGLNTLYTSVGNSFHHNTMIWDEGATGHSGYMQHDAADQPNFFAKNTPPDFNAYHLPSLSMTTFLYDNNNSQKNQSKTFEEYQTAGADVHGTADTNIASGFPVVSLSAPADGATVSGHVAVHAGAADKSGVEKVELYDDWKLVQTVTAGPYDFTWSSAAGSHVLAVMGYSKAGVRNCRAVTVTVP